jgi:hypothetical protein
MAAVVLDTSMSLDGLVTGPGPGPINRRARAGSGCTSAPMGSRHSASGTPPGPWGDDSWELRWGDEPSSHMMQIHLVQVVPGDGTRLFDGLGREPVELEWTRAIEPPGITDPWLRSVP